MESTARAAEKRRTAEVEPGSLRHQVLLATQKFRSTWVELGGLLVRVSREGTYRQWGFESFEQYCTRELRLKKKTALKLTASYSFLARHEKSALDPQAAGPRPAPPFEVISVLADAEQRGQLGDEDYRQLRSALWEEERSPAQLVRELSRRFPSPPPPPPDAGQELRRLAAAARKLAASLRGCKSIPEAVAERAEALAEDVEELARGAPRAR